MTEMTMTQQVLTIALCVLGTMATRFLPFVLFPQGKPTPAYVKYLGRALPLAAFCSLMASSLSRGCRRRGGPHLVRQITEFTQRRAFGRVAVNVLPAFNAYP